MSLAEGSTLTISGFLTIAEELPVGATVTLDIVKEGLIDLPIPCLDLGVAELGSWYVFTQLTLPCHSCNVNVNIDCCPYT